jgi:hypothetical protein
MSHFNMGAINITTGEHEIPRVASKQYTYKCPNCESKVKFCKGKIKAPYFSHHRSDHPCTFYMKPSESQTHKEGKRILKTLIDKVQDIRILRECSSCDEYNFVKNKQTFRISRKPSFHTATEHKFIFNNSQKSADVALLDGNKIVSIFEICHTHATLSINRPEPWYEISAKTIIDFANSAMSYPKTITISCIREWTCSFCLSKIARIKQYTETRRIEREREENKMRENQKRRQYEEAERTLMFKNDQLSQDKIVEEENKMRENERRRQYEEAERTLMFKNDQLSQDKILEEQRRLDLCQEEERIRVKELKEQIREDSKSKKKVVDKNTIEMLFTWKKTVEKSF